MRVLFSMLLLGLKHVNHCVSPESSLCTQDLSGLMNKRNTKNSINKPLISEAF